jgi:hypothetical protein
MAFGWIGATTAFGAVVKKPQTRCGPRDKFGLSAPVTPLEHGPNARERE